MLSRAKRGHSRLNRPTTAPNIDLFTDNKETLFSNNHELLDGLLSRSTVGYPSSDSVASRVLELQTGYVLYMLSTAAGRIEVRVGDTNASFRISRLPISIFQWISIFGDFQALYELPTRTLTSLAVLVSSLHRLCDCGRRCCGFISLTDGQKSFQWGGLQASNPGITESIPVRGTPKSSEGDMSPRPPVKYHPGPLELSLSISNGFRDIQCQVYVTQWLKWPWYDL